MGCYQLWLKIISIDVDASLYILNLWLTSRLFLNCGGIYQYGAYNSKLFYLGVWYSKQEFSMDGMLLIVLLIAPKSTLAILMTHNRRRSVMFKGIKNWFPSNEHSHDTRAGDNRDEFWRLNQTHNTENGYVSVHVIAKRTATYCPNS